MSSQNKIKIQPKGSYFQTDKDGFLINPTDIRKVQEKWKPLIEDIIDLYKNAFGKNLKHVFLRGSVAKGEAVDHVSDVDTFAYVTLPEDELKKNDYIPEIKNLLEKYRFVQDIEIAAHPVTHIPDDSITLTQSLCVYGESISVPKLKPGKHMAIHAPSFHRRFVFFAEFLETDTTDKEVKEICVWLMKGLLRVGFELTMERSQKYTRDLYRCYETFSEYYPEIEPDMRKALDLALNPTTDKNKIKKIMENLGAWLLAEIPNHFEIKKDHQ